MYNKNIPFHKNYFSGAELENIASLLSGRAGQLHGSNTFTDYCSNRLAETYSDSCCLLTPSGTHALEMIALLMDIGPGDEIIIPAFTHYSTANAFLLRGASVICVDVDPKTLNIDISAAQEAITTRTKAIVAVHYGGISCDMDRLLAIADATDLYILEDAALSFGAAYKGKQLGSCGAAGCLSFHSAKNLTSGGEGGALLLNSDFRELHSKAEIIQYMGTDRSSFRKGNISSYTWRAAGSSYVMSELSAACLAGQLDSATYIRDKRVKLWDTYYRSLAALQGQDVLQLPVIPDYSSNNGHMFWIMTQRRDALRKYLMKRGIETATHYVPLSRTPFATESDRVIFREAVSNAEKTETELLRLPIYPELEEDDIIYICECIDNFQGQ